MVNPIFEAGYEPSRFTGRIVPIYRLKAGLSQRTVMQCVRSALDFCADSLPDYLPRALRSITASPRRATPMRTSTSPRTPRPSP